MSIPRISVVMACHNGENYLKESLDSILAQSFADYEFVIVDDGSTDMSGQILADYANSDDRIVLIRNDTCMGLTRSLCTAIGQSRGEYIARQDADDLSCENRLALQQAALDENNDLVLIGTAQIIIDAMGCAVHYPATIQHDAEIRRLLCHGNVFAHGSVMFRRDAYERVNGYDERFRCAQDYELWLRMQHAGQFKVLPEKLYKWRKLDTSVSATKKELQVAFTLLALLKSDWCNATNSTRLLDAVTVVSQRDALAIILNHIETIDDRECYSVMGNALLRCGDLSRSQSYLFRSRKARDVAKAFVSLNQKTFDLAKKIYCNIQRW